VRFLHTSDWHLGRSFHQVGLLGAQAAFVDHLVETVRAEEAPGDRCEHAPVPGDVAGRECLQRADGRDEHEDRGIEATAPRFGDVHV
jgi:hypothetical protein